METAQEGSLPRKCASTSEQKYRKLLTHAQQSPIRDFTPQRFSIRGQSQLCLPVSEVINATDCLEPTWMMRLSPCKSSQQIHSPTVILPFQWSFSLPPSFLFEDHVAMLATVSVDANQILPSFGLFTCLRHQMWSHSPVAQGSFSSSHWNWVFATYQVLKKLRTANREDRHRELFIYRGRHNPCVMDCSPCNEHLLPLARNVNNGASEYKEQCKPLKTRANPLQLYVFTCWEVYSAR